MSSFWTFLDYRKLNLATDKHRLTDQHLNIKNSAYPSKSARSTYFKFLDVFRRGEQHEKAGHTNGENLLGERKNKFLLVINLHLREAYIQTVSIYYIQIYFINTYSIKYYLLGCAAKREHTQMNLLYCTAALP